MLGTKTQGTPRIFSPQHRAGLAVLLSHSDALISRQLSAPFKKYGYQVLEQGYLKDNTPSSVKHEQDICFEIDRLLQSHGFSNEQIRVLALEPNLGKSTETPPLADLMNALIMKFPEVHIFLYSGTEEYANQFKLAKELLSKSIGDEKLKLIHYQPKGGDWTILRDIAQKASRAETRAPEPREEARTSQIVLEEARISLHREPVTVAQPSRASFCWFHWFCCCGVQAAVPTSGHAPPTPSLL
ncbi:MAG: hypothetical protein K0S29_971 [Gammaproteobacteria bacterium]|jgi:hypothetical protein|nr:hypothetical protein [Gammaproteobacteria bacterium]